MLVRLCLFAALMAVPVAAVQPARAQDDDTVRALSVMTTRVRELHDRLRITDAEQPQWRAFADAMMENARHMASLHAEQGDAIPPSAPADMRQYAAVAQAHAEDTQRLLAPLEQLYAVMTPDQRRVADETFHKITQERLRRTGS